MSEIIYNFESAPLSGRYYGGNSGRKQGITWNNSDWLLKYPQLMRGLAGKNLPPFTMDPQTEWLGSHVYRMLGVPAHDTVLGVRDHQIVVACKDFTTPGKQLVSFHDLRNTMSDNTPGYVEAPSKGRGSVLNDVLNTISRQPLLSRLPETLHRFWTMFTVDAIIRNIDRNNTNWGILIRPHKTVQLAPVFDNGNSLETKRGLQQIHDHLTDPSQLRQDALNVQSFYTNARGQNISPLKFLKQATDPIARQTAKQIINEFSLKDLASLIDQLPDKAEGLSVAPDEWKQYQYDLISYRINQVLKPDLGLTASKQAATTAQSLTDRHHYHEIRR